jgi:hypothetical protein
VIYLKGQDVITAIKLAIDPREWTYPLLAKSVGLSLAETHAAIQRGIAAKLINPETLRPIRRNLIEFLRHGIQYAFIPKRAGVVRGVRTAHAASPLRDAIAAEDDLPPVWPYAEGDTRGEAVEPLYPSAVKACLSDPALYECLALVDCLRIGRARERKLAGDLLEQRLSSDPKAA